MLEELIAIDKSWFIAIHSFRNGFLDFVMPVITNRWIWIPLYLFLAYRLLIAYKSKTWMILLAAGIMILFSDQGANLFKNGIKRHRPCHDVELLKQTVISTPAGCGGPYGYFSGHAANSFALAVFVFLLIYKTGTEKWRPWLLLFLWAIVVGWSRIYMGVHFPGDIISGAVFGSLVGVSVYLGLNKFYMARNNG